MKQALIIISIIFSCSCKQNITKPNLQQVDAYRKKLTGIHKQIVTNDSDSIKRFVAKMGWNMKTSNTGLWYEILNEGQGDSICKGDIVSIKYRISLLNGEFCYSSDSTGIKTFKSGYGGVESGLEEGILLLKKGSKARFIMPPHLAHGVMGDQNRIPRLAILMYEVEITDHKKYVKK